MFYGSTNEINDWYMIAKLAHYFKALDLHKSFLKNVELHWIQETHHTWKEYTNRNIQVNNRTESYT